MVTFIEWLTRLLIWCDIINYSQLGKQMGQRARGEKMSGGIINWCGWVDRASPLAQQEAIQGFRLMWESANWKDKQMRRKLFDPAIKHLILAFALLYLKHSSFKRQQTRKTTPVQPCQNVDSFQGSSFVVSVGSRLTLSGLEQSFLNRSWDKVTICVVVLCWTAAHTTTHSSSKAVQGPTPENFPSQAPSYCVLKSFFHSTIHCFWYSVSFPRVQQEEEVALIWLLYFGSDFWFQVGGADAFRWFKSTAKTFLTVLIFSNTIFSVKPPSGKHAGGARERGLM